MFLLKKIFNIEQLNLRVAVTLFGIKIKFKSKKVKQQINKASLSRKIGKFAKSGICEVSRKPRLIVSLTSFPERMAEIKYTLYSLLTQTLKPDMVVLWLAKEQFPEREKDIPQEVLNLCRYGLSIKWCNDLKSYKKLVPALQEFPHDILITADDDLFYEPKWLEKLYNAYLENPQIIHCHRAHYIQLNADGSLKKYTEWEQSVSASAASYRNFCTTGGGVLYPPKCFYQDVCQEKLFQKLSPTADDIWFWAMLVLNGKKIQVIKDNLPIKYVCPEREMGLTKDRTLASVNLGLAKNDEQLKNIIVRYPDIIVRLNKESQK